MVQVENLHKSYGKTKAVQGISLEVMQGEIFGIVGPNGAGKTSTVECIEGLRIPDSGKVRVLGLDPIRDSAALKRQIGIQLQEGRLPDRIKVWEAMDLFGSFHKSPADRRRLLIELGLSEKSDAYFETLSGGQKQRLVVALALVGNPKVVFFDELSTGLDPQARRAMWDLVRGVRESGKTVLLVTHFMDEAERLCDRVAIIDHGKLLGLDTPSNLIRGVFKSSMKVTFTVGPGFDLVALAGERLGTMEQKGDTIAIIGRLNGLLSMW